MVHLGYCCYHDRFDRQNLATAIFVNHGAHRQPRHSQVESEVQQAARALELRQSKLALHNTVTSFWALTL
jgi:hypothetical protein